jgi:hypothetical protein
VEDWAIREGFTGPKRWQAIGNSIQAFQAEESIGDIASALKMSFFSSGMKVSCGMTPNSCMLLKYTVDSGQRSLVELTAAYDGS